MSATCAYPTFTSYHMPWMRTLPNGTILLVDDDGQPFFALTPAAAEDLSAALERRADHVRAGAVPANREEGAS
jgi:hypothetical protein